MTKAMTTLEFLRRDEETRRLYEERQRALRDYASDMEGAPLEDIADITELSIVEIQKLQDETH
ncbi:MAG: hypothetical protein A2201_08825 [Alicyclobacillus sp. RIFOXYA1_FULL_53_8]|nr:MAG: hypothetical protein A2201_08825 [Alicyclobacillus sp. RIFOXYA1_FULL_53_8]